MHNLISERKNIQNSFSVKIKELIETRATNQKQLAKLLGVGQSTVNSWCTGQREPSLNMLLWICLTLNIEPNKLLGYDEMR